MPEGLHWRLPLESRQSAHHPHPVMRIIGFPLYRRPSAQLLSLRFSSASLHCKGFKCQRDNDGMLDARFPSVIHPAVMTHPESGRKCLFLSPTYVDGFLGLKQDESDALLWQLTEHMLQPRFVYRHNWRVNDAILWDICIVVHTWHNASRRAGSPYAALSYAALSIRLRSPREHWYPSESQPA
jgi:hypothetical protein